LARAWIENSSRALKKPVNSVEDFVEQVNALQKINQYYQDFRDKVDLYSSNYQILAKEDLNVDKNDKDNFKQTDAEAKAL
jgi:4-hydroxyphenylpyruvate dioxygenase-like putative hemolysin